MMTASFSIMSFTCLFVPRIEVVIVVSEEALFSRAKTLIPNHFLLI